MKKPLLIVVLLFILSIQLLTAQKVYKDSTVINFFRRTAGWIASDGGLTATLADGSTLWLMGDSHIDDYDAATGTIPCLFQVRNAAVLQPANNWDWRATTTLTGNSSGIKSYLKNNASDTFFMWPGAGIQLKDTVYVYCGSLKNAGSGAFGFAAAGNDVMAKIHYPSMKVVGYEVLPGFQEINFGIGFILSADGYVYAYGQKLHYLTNNLYVARFKANKPTKEWQFWNGTKWQADVRLAKAIASQDGVSGTFHISKVKDKLLLVSSALSINCDAGKDIYTSFSDHLTGPFTGRKTIYTIDDTLQGHYPFFYTTVAHPGFINDKEELLITYSINGYGTCVETCINGRLNPDYYRLKAIRVPMQLIF
ncbi:hypothetical protein I5907_19985 [Panacibacter sp. DH6]|uniref:DUF4185 domain-containing protein n=1 Tax=Panacibacter microcysteis TaxID=2793269 RepID=A0A931H032_9BACT|nr:hypothetical protein [Panacibacter microcysteis]MBG9378526.1 hypothetical protein [Panacibacter microcysteis]